MAKKKKDEIGGDVKGAQDITPETPEVEPETTPEAEPQKEEEEISLSSKELANRINAGKAEIGRQLKAALDAQVELKRNFDTQSTQYKNLEQTIRQLKQRERERELRSAEGTPDVLDTIRLKHQVEDEREQTQRERSELEAEKARHQAAIDRSAKIEADTLAKELAKDSGLTATLLLQIASDTADGRTTYNLERMKQIAKSIPKESSEEEEESEEGAEKETAVRGQRSRAVGTGGRAAGRGYRTFADYEKAFIAGEISFEQYQEAAKRFNVQI